MRRVHFGDNHRYVCGEAVRGIVGHYGDFLLRVRLFQSANFCLVHIYGAKNEIYAVGNFIHICFCIKDDHVLKLRRNRGFKRPFIAYGFRIAFACRTGGCRQNDNVKPRMVCKKVDKALTNHTRCANYTNVKLFHVNSFSPRRAKKK